MSSLHLIERGALMFPTRLREDGEGIVGLGGHRPNLSKAAHRYLKRPNVRGEDLFHHILALLTTQPTVPPTRARIPLPGWPDGNAADAAETLGQLAARGRELARLLDSDTPVFGVTQGNIRPEITAVAVPATTDRRNMTGSDFALTAGWAITGAAAPSCPAKAASENAPSPQTNARPS